jgi:UDP-N-acetylmuramoylalanine--D-glutamate ligase
MNFFGQHVLVLGLGESGLAMANWLLKNGAKLRVADTRVRPERLDTLLASFPEVTFISGEFQSELLQDINLVCVSPGLSPLRELQAIVPAANQQQIPVWGEVELFSQALLSLAETQSYRPKVIAITGTNGKTTVTSLVGQLCQRAGLTTKVAGNISPAMLDVLRSAIDTDALPQAWVLELSSFQLHSSISLAPQAATVLNISQDHLDWHGDMAAYCADKARIFSSNTVAVINRQDPLVKGLLAASNEDALSFGTDAPTKEGEFGLVNENGMAWLAVAQADDSAAEKSQSKRKKVNQPSAKTELEVLVSKLMPVDALRIRGLHNAMNALAALALCRAIGLPLAPLLHGLRTYEGQPHRVELVATVNGVDYIDDSKGTNVGATVAALNGLGDTSRSDQQRIILIAGGEGKGQDFTPLRAPVHQFVKKLVLIGKAAEHIRAAVNLDAASTANIAECTSLQDAVALAASTATAGDIVLLSPACASFDMFRNYEHRAEVFKDAVREVQLVHGEVC